MLRVNYASHVISASRVINCHFALRAVIYFERG